MDKAAAVDYAMLVVARLIGGTGIGMCASSRSKKVK
jgi:predicted MFS family arabinose efflux permease